MKQDQTFLLNNAKLIKKMYQYILFNFFILKKVFITDQNITKNNLNIKSSKVLYIFYIIFCFIIPQNTYIRIN